jgi:citrate lyase subunit beta / citryl-CoA lyase
MSTSFGNPPTIGSRPLRLRRSSLSTPGSNPKMIAKAVASRADLVLLDLEDAVAPAEKAGARPHVVAALNELDWGRSTRAVRINGVDTPWCHDDLIEVVSAAGAHLDVIIVPKVFGPREVWFVEDMLTQLERKHDLAVGRIGIEVLIEEVRALDAVSEIARCSPRLESLILGVGDLAASQGMRLGHIGETGDAAGSDVWHYARTRLIVAARSAGIDPIDGPLANIADLAGFEASARSFARIGGVGKWCIHPSQIEPANRVFAPTVEEVAQAQRAIDAVNEATARGAGAASLDGKMIDAATARSFANVLDIASRCAGDGDQP